MGETAEPGGKACQNVMGEDVRSIMGELLTAIRNIKVPVLDLYAVSGIQPEIEIIREMYMPDGLHPNDAGTEIIAKRLMGFLSQYS